MMFWMLCAEPEDVKNFTAIIVNETFVQASWLADGRALQYTVFWRHRNKVFVAVELNSCISF